jgi:hypothetical protein
MPPNLKQIGKKRGANITYNAKVLNSSWSGNRSFQYDVGRAWSQKHTSDVTHVPMFAQAKGYKQRSTAKQRRAYVKDNFSSQVWGFGPTFGDKVRGQAPRVTAVIDIDEPLRVIHQIVAPTQSPVGNDLAPARRQQKTV